MAGDYYALTDEEKKSVSFISTANMIVSLYSCLPSTDAKIYILIDELELTLKKGKNYERDITLIRDLIFAIQYINEISKRKNFNVYCISAIRNEVYKNVVSRGYEINKPIQDFGIQITWQQKGGNINEHPLLKMLEHRIRKSEESQKICNEDIWNTYFDKTVNRVEVKNYLLDMTWYKPRDIIRIFNLIQKMQGYKSYVNQEVMDTIRQRYSEEAWGEFEEELSVKYTSNEIEGIKQSLIGLQLPFELKDFIKQMDSKKDVFEEVEELINSKKKPAQVLRDLYDIGVIGNYGITARFTFKGDKDIDPMMPYTIHHPLCRFFKTSIKKINQRREEYNNN